MTNELNKGLVSGIVFIGSRFKKQTFNTEYQALLQRKLGNCPPPPAPGQPVSSLQVMASSAPPLLSSPLEQKELTKLGLMPTLSAAWNAKRRFLFCKNKIGMGERQDGRAFWVGVPTAGMQRVKNKRCLFGQECNLQFKVASLGSCVGLQKS